MIIKVTVCAICGSDLQLMDGTMLTMKVGRVLGQEFMGEVVEVGQGFQVEDGSQDRGALQHQIRRGPAVPDR